MEEKSTQKQKYLPVDRTQRHARRVDFHARNLPPLSGANAIPVNISANPRIVFGSFDYASIAHDRIDRDVIRISRDPVDRANVGLNSNLNINPTSSEEPHSRNLSSSTEPISSPSQSAVISMPTCGPTM